MHIAWGSLLQGVVLLAGARVWGAELASRKQVSGTWKRETPAHTEGARRTAPGPGCAGEIEA